MSPPLFQANHHNGRLFLWRPSKTIDSKGAIILIHTQSLVRFSGQHPVVGFPPIMMPLSFSISIHLLEYVLLPFWRVVRRGIVCHSSRTHLSLSRSSMSCKTISLHHSMSELLDAPEAFWQCISQKAFFWNGSTSSNTDLELLLKIGNSLSPTVVHLLVLRASLYKDSSFGRSYCLTTPSPLLCHSKLLGLSKKIVRTHVGFSKNALLLEDPTRTRR